MNFQVVSITFFKGGEAYNVIPESVAFGGTLRSMTDEGLSYLMKRIKEVKMLSVLSFVVQWICWNGDD